MALEIGITAAQVVASTVDVPGRFTQRVIQEIKVVIPTVANAVTFTFSILDVEGDTRYGIAGIAKATTTIILVDRLVKPGYKFSILPSGATGTAITALVYPDYETVL